MGNRTKNKDTKKFWDFTIKLKIKLKKNTNEIEKSNIFITNNKILLNKNYYKKYILKWKV